MPPKKFSRNLGLKPETWRRLAFIFRACPPGAHKSVQDLGRKLLDRAVSEELDRLQGRVR